MHISWIEPVQLVEFELRQRREEGVDADARPAAAAPLGRSGGVLDQSGSIRLARDPARRGPGADLARNAVGGAAQPGSSADSGPKCAG